MKLHKCRSSYEPSYQLVQPMLEIVFRDSFQMNHSCWNGAIRRAGWSRINMKRKVVWVWKHRYNRNRWWNGAEDV